MPTPPYHIAIIMDGNRRWAAERHLPKIMGHTEGKENVRRIIQAANDHGVSFLTLYTLSTENLKNRSNEELNHIFSLLSELPNFVEEFTNNNVRVKIIGNISELPEKTQKDLFLLIEKTKDNSGMTVSFAINYGGRDEILRAIEKMREQNISEKITEEIFEKYLDTNGMPDVDLVIRTAGEQRLSNYLPWQTVYAELFFTSIKWPDFSGRELQKAIEWFHEQKRNKGK